MAFIYHYNPETMIFDQTLIVSELSEQLPANTTTVSPDDVVQPAKWDNTAQQWTGQSLTDWHAQYDQDSQATPTAEQQQLANLIKSNAKQMALNAQLIKQVAELQAAKANTTQEAK